MFTWLILETVSCRVFNQIISKEEKISTMERLTSRDKDSKLTVRVVAHGKPVS